MAAVEGVGVDGVGGRRSHRSHSTLQTTGGTWTLSYEQWEAINGFQTEEQLDQDVLLEDMSSRVFGRMPIIEAIIVAQMW